MNKKQEKMIAEFHRTLADLDVVLEDLPHKGLDWAAGEGEWSIREVLHHLAEDCNVYAFIIESALATPDCKVFFGEFPGNQAWGKSLAFDQRPVENARTLMHAHRDFLAELVGHFPDRWENKVNFYNTDVEKIADSTVAKMLVMLTEHMQEHTEMIQGIIQMHRGD
jgi:hypothetical protein